MDLLNSISNFDYDLGKLTYGADRPTPLGDVSMGEPAMTTNTATGNGTGVFQAYDWGTAIGGGLSKVLDYAIRRDEIKLGIAAPLGQPTTSQQVQVQGKQTNVIFLLLLALGVYVVVKS